MHIIDRLTTIAIVKFPSISHILRPFTTASVTLMISDIRNSVKTTLKKSRSFISSTLIPRIIIVELCEPQFPPVLISIGINETSSGIAEHASSYLVSIVPVIAADSISTKSQNTLFFACFISDVLKYDSSVGLIAAIRSISSVASACITSIASSNVTIPTSLPSSSTTGIVTKSYLFMSFATSSLSSSVCTQMIVLSMMSHILSSGCDRRSVFTER